MADGQQTPLGGFTVGLQQGLDRSRQSELDEERRAERAEDRRVQERAQELDLNSKIASDKNLPMSARLKATNEIFRFRNEFLAGDDGQIEMLDPDDFENVQEAIERFGPAVKAIRASGQPLAKQRELLEDAINEQGFKAEFGQKAEIERGVLGQIPQETKPTAFLQNVEGLSKMLNINNQEAVSLLKGAKEMTEEAFIQKGVQGATASGITPDVNTLIPMLRDAYRQSQGVVGGSPQTATGGGRQITPELAQSYLQEAQGDKARARELAKQDGYTF